MSSIQAAHLVTAALFLWGFPLLGAYHQGWTRGFNSCDCQKRRNVT